MQADVVHDASSNVLLIGDSVLSSIEFRREGVIFKDRQTVTDHISSVIIDKPVKNFPWVGQFIFHSASSNKRFPEFEIVEQLRAENRTVEDINKIYVIIGMKDERARIMYRTKSSKDLAEEACTLIEKYLLDYSNVFPNSEIIWLGVGKLRTTTEKHSHVEEIIKQAIERSWATPIKFINIFESLNNGDIKNMYGNLTLRGSKKIANALEHILTR